MDILEKIVAKKRIYLESQKEKTDYKTLREQAEAAFGERERPSFFDALKNYEKISIIAEVKKASPSKGLIRPDLDHMDVAREYLKSDVQAMSVLTETDFFLGKPEFLSDIAEISDKPLLRKDFVIDDYQIYEASLLGASAILLIAAILDDKTMARYMEIAHGLNLDCLAEVHNSEELRRVNALGARIVGVNNRNLKTFEEDLTVSERLLGLLEERNKKVLISESGIRSSRDLRYIESIGADGALIGELFMRRDNISAAVSDLRSGRLG